MITILIIICLFLAFLNGSLVLMLFLVARDAMRQRKMADELDDILQDYLTLPFPVISDVGKLVGKVYPTDDGKNILFYDN
jgi:hypothetical protein